MEPHDPKHVLGIPRVRFRHLFRPGSVGVGKALDSRDPLPVASATVRNVAGSVTATHVHGFVLRFPGSAQRAARSYKQNPALGA